MKMKMDRIVLLIIIQLLFLCKIFASDPTICAVTKCNGQNSTTTSGFLKKCRCDKDCGIYGDCCIDSPYKANALNAFTSKTFNCNEIKFRPQGTYIKHMCRVTMTNISVRDRRRKCLQSVNYDEQVSDYEVKLPVTTPNGITYGNRYCAECDDITNNNFTKWNIHFACESRTMELNTSRNNFTLGKFSFNDTLQKWVYTDANQTETCVFSPIPPSRIRKLLRRCYSKMVGSCPSAMSVMLPTYVQNCLDYTSIVQHKNGTYYKNEYCALCNNVSSTDLLCRRVPRNSNTIDTTTATMSASSASSTIATTALSTQNTPITTIRRFFPTSPRSNNNNTNFTTEVREFLRITVKQNCKDLIDSLTLAKLVVEIKSFSTMKRTSIRQTNLLSGYPVRICKEKDDNEQEEEPELQESGALKFIVNLGIIVSILFTTSHLYDFLFSNTSSATVLQRSFASYAVALLIGNVGFLASNTNVIGSCQLLGAITYFGFLTSFFWLSALAFDISCKIWCCVEESNLLGTNLTNSQKFTTYTLVSWIFPPIVVFIMTYVAEKNDDFILEGRIYETCWFQNDQTLLIFFVFPLTVTTSVNLAFYLFSVYVVSVQRSAVVKLFAKHGIDFKFHTGLIITSNLMWSAALIGMYYEDSFLWICFAYLNATTGLLVYLCSPVKRAFSIKISTYLNKHFLPVSEQ